MPLTRKFLDWSAPALDSAAEFLIERYADSSGVDLENVVVVVPGGHAGRSLLEILVRRCDQSQRVLLPPQITTVGHLPELLYESKQPFALDFIQQLAWVHALRSEGRRRLSRIIPALPDEDDVPRWLALGKLLWRQHRELAAEGQDFNDVVDVGWRRAEIDEKNRWKLLRRVQEKYLHILDHYELWDLQTARLYAIEHGLCRSDRDIVLVATADMNKAVRSMLAQVADRVTALVFAPSSMADRFDAFGCIDCDAWCEATIDLDDQQVVLADGPADQADAVAAVLASYGGKYRADQIAIGAPDPTVAPQVQRRLMEGDIHTRGAVGRSMPETAPFRLLSAIAGFLERGRFEDFAALARHPDVGRWLDARTNNSAWLTQLDQYFSHRLQPRLGKWLGDEQEHALVAEAYAHIEQLLLGVSDGRRKLADWSGEIVALVHAIYDGVPLDRENEADSCALQAAQEMQRCLADRKCTPAELMPIVTASQAIRLLLAQIETAQCVPLSDPAAIELFGWLELPLHTSPAMIVTSFNEGFVPTSVNADMFLPNRLRRRLGLLDNRRRYARDAYALSMLLAARRELTLIIGRRNQDGDPLAPSRLLFATDTRTMAKRCLRFFRGDEPEESPIVASKEAASKPSSAKAKTAIYVPQPGELASPIEAMSVTSFRSYLACPFRYYLRHVLRLDPLSDQAEELDAPAFGNLLHDVLNRFGRSRQKNSTNADHIRSYLKDALNKLVAARYGRTRLAPVNVQLLQASVRLDAFAAWQAQWAAAGWEIVHAETPEGADRAVLDLGGGESMELYGRIDRVDRHRESGRWVIFDYKTGETPKTPERAHRRAGEWTDLQLPLYQHFVGPLGIDGDVEYGYIVLPKDTSKVGELLAEWSPADLAAADVLAKDIARNVRSRKFWPPADPPPNMLQEYGVICQEQAFDKQLAGEVRQSLVEVA